MYIYIYVYTSLIEINQIKVVLVLLMLFQCHQESTQFNFVLVFLNIVFKQHNLRKLFNSQCQGYENYFKVVRGFENVLSYNELCSRGTKTFCQLRPGLKNSSKIPSVLVPGIGNDYSLNS